MFGMVCSTDSVPHAQVHGISSRRITSSQRQIEREKIGIDTESAEGGG